MDYIEVTKNKRSRRVALAIMLLGFLIGIIAIAMSSSKIDPFTAAHTIFLGGLFGFGIALIGFVLYAPLSAEERQHRDRKVLSELNARYDLGLSRTDFMGLGYPATHPQHSFVQYGSIEMVRRSERGGYSKREIFLLWDQGQMVLANSEDGELKRLKPVAEVV